MTEHGHTVIGNESLLLRLERDIRNDRLSHAYILDGAEGSGRHTIAKHICASLACHHRPGRVMPEDDPDQVGFFDDLLPPTAATVSPADDTPFPCGFCPACIKVLEDKCPDIHVIGRSGKASIGVDAIRFLRQDVLIPPNDIDTKIYIIEDAEAMTVQAQNALLLTLEEPPSYVLFLLLCNGTDPLLETIRSRAPILRTRPVSDDQVRAYLQTQKKHLPEEELRAILLRAGGCIGQALTLSDAKAIKPLLRRRTLADDFISSCTDRRADRVLTAVTQFGTKREEVQEVLGYVVSALRDLLLLKTADRVILTYYTDEGSGRDVAFRISTRTLLRINRAVNQARDALERNANVRLTLTHMCMDAGLL